MINHENFPFTSGAVAVTFEPVEGRLDVVEGSIIGVGLSGLTLQYGFSGADWLPWSVIRHVQIRNAPELSIRAIAERLAHAEAITSIGGYPVPPATVDTLPER